LFIEVVFVIGRCRIFACAQDNPWFIMWIRQRHNFPQRGEFLSIICGVAMGARLLRGFADTAVTICVSVS